MLIFLFSEKKTKPKQKINMINKKHLSPIFLVLSLTFLGLGCVKKDAESKIAQVLLVPLSPNATAVDFSINGKYS